MLVLTALVYPAVLALLCAGAGLLVDRASGRLLAGPLILPVGAAALIAVSQLTTYIVFLAPATPVVLVLFAAGGFALAWWQAVRQGSRAGAILRSALRAPLGWPGGVSVLVYLIALAPVLAAGRPTFSSFMALSDSAVHLIGADYLIHHGQSYAHLDLRNSYGQFINDYYNTSYPSGADTLFGGSALALGLPLIWAFQPFVAFMLASAAGPAWLLVRRVGLGGAWAALATLSMTLPALVYAYELLGSVKEIAVLGAILALGVLAVDSGRWLRGPSTAGIPFALLAAAGVSALGVGFGVWVLAAAVVVLGVLAVQARELAGPRHAARRSRMARGLLWLLGIGAVVGLVSALADVERCLGLGAGDADHLGDEQPGEPAGAAARRAGARRVAARQLQARAGRWRAHADLRADRAHAGGVRAGRRAADRDRPVGADRLAGAGARRVAGCQRAARRRG